MTWTDADYNRSDDASTRPSSKDWRKTMASIQPRYSKEEFARRGEAIFERDIRPVVEGADERKFVVIDIETGAYEIDADELAASDRLLARVPTAQIWLRRVGSAYAHRFGPRGR